MKRTIVFFLAAMLSLSPALAQSRKVVKQAKEDAKILASQLKSEGYKTLDNVKLEDAARDYLSDKYSEKSTYESVGKATSKDLNDAKAQARREAIGYYASDDVLNSFFVYRKNRRKYDVVCYALLKTSSNSKSFSRSSEGAARQVKDAKDEARKMEKEAIKDQKKADKKAEKQAEKARQKAEKAHEKAVDKANEKARKAIEKADAERDKALRGL